MAEYIKMIAIVFTLKKQMEVSVGDENTESRGAAFL